MHDLATSLESFLYFSPLVLSNCNYLCKSTRMNIFPHLIIVILLQKFPSAFLVCVARKQKTLNICYVHLKNSDEHSQRLPSKGFSREDDFKTL